MTVNFVYMTAGSRSEARTIGSALVAEKLAACVNIFDNMNSLYLWQGELQDDTETVLIAKTTRACVPALIEKVKTLHSYECPCIVCLPVSDGNSAFLDWIRAEVQR